MLPRPLRLHTSRDIRAVARLGTRVSGRYVVVHVNANDDAGAHARFGVIVSKAVGNAVERHRVSRQFRHVAAEFTDVPTGHDLLLRARPGAATAATVDLRADVARAMRRGVRKHATRLTQAPATQTDVPPA